MQISVIGSGKSVKDDIKRHAHRCGALIAHEGHTFICGGNSGIVAAASEGARSEVASLFAFCHRCGQKEGIPHRAAYVCTGIGDTRHQLVVASGSLVIAVPGSYGTFSEISYAALWDKTILILRKEAFPFEGKGAFRGKNVKYVDNIGELTQELCEYHGF